MARTVTTRGSMKPIVAAAIPLITAFAEYFETREVNSIEWAVGLTGIVAAIIVYFVPNQDAGFRAATKAICALAVPLVSALIQWGLGEGAPTATVIVGFVTAATMYFVQSKPNTDNQQNQ